MDENRDDEQDDAWYESLEGAPELQIGLDGRRWTVDDFYARDSILPEKMELIDGKLFWSRRERLGMLACMLEQVGLREAVKLAPKALWLEALKEVED